MKRAITLLGSLSLLLIIASAIFIVINRVPDRPVEALTARWAQPPSQFVEINGMKIHLRDEGPRNDPTPILLLHGTSSSLHTWNGWSKELNEQRRVIRFDMPGFGLTGPSPDNVYTIERYAQTVIAVLDQLNIERSVLAGNSLGGYVAWATALFYPERVEQLVLVDASGYPFKAESIPIGFRIANTPILNTLMEDVMPRSMVKSSLENVYGNPTLVTSELVDRYFDLMTRSGNRKALVERFRQTQPGQLADRVPELKQPTLILWGKLDRLIPPDNADRFHHDISGSTLVLFEDLGHVPQEEDPVSTVSALKRFLANSKSIALSPP
ncbi:alpha/beta hydrolase [Aestuariirhabdus sp. Z084]|uniref:alpha/beta fold hydrolase n=1 Tax=Aestuariirhabdus haliotis TaxID=2918751 RepID=UPI0020BF236F|nr:alpha/beta hydrolase [Aestuariirhabdus haliotis]MCL6416683.1 alpha/beta hydrolase [Aestuariirhabdus haliotis]